MNRFIEANTEEMYKVLKELCQIPAPSHFEDKRAEYCKNKLLEYGADNVHIDSAKNVIFPMNCDDSDNITVFVAHTDTVYPDIDSMPYLDDGEFIYSPGVGDDTASVVVLMLSAKYLIENGIIPKEGILFVLNSCEEGLGNLKGTRQLFEDYKGRIKQFVSYDENIGRVVNQCVGSHRYEVEVTTEGGHSYLAYGNKNAIAELSNIIHKIYEIEIPEIDNSKTTLNVGTITGGTSVNTIAQSAKMLCEYRSTDVRCLQIMKKNFEEVFREANSDEVTVSVKVVGDRPCADGVSEERIKQLTELFSKVVEDVIGKTPSIGSSSTDCNIPLSMGIPAICAGVYTGKGQHTREECIEKASMITGLELGIKHILSLINE